MERRNQTLVEAARTMLIFSRAPLFLWAEAIATACYTQNRSIIHRRFDKTPYELITDRKPDISFFHVFRAFIGYSANSYAYRVYNRRTKKKMKTTNVTFDELSAMAFEKHISKHGLQSMTSGQITMYDDYIGGQPSSATRTAPAAQAPQVLQTLTASTTTADTAPTPTNSSSQATNIPTTLQDVDELVQQQQHVQQQDNQAPLQPEIVDDNVLNAMLDGNTFVNPFAPPSTNDDHPLEQVIGEPSRPVLIRNQLRTDGDMCMYELIVSIMEPRNIKEAMTDLAWIESMQEELLQFKRLDVWVLVPALDNIKPLTLKWLFKN
ncbi:putative ribonuclease H-like domain-containing protein [Tanacetum coccineum]